MVYFETVGEVSDTCATLVGMCDNYDLVATIDEFAGQLVDVTLDSSVLGKEEVADHCDVVRHLGGLLKRRSIM